MHCNWIPFKWSIHLKNLPSHNCQRVDIHSLIVWFFFGNLWSHIAQWSSFPRHLICIMRKYFFLCRIGKLFNMNRWGDDVRIFNMDDIGLKKDSLYLFYCGFILPLARPKSKIFTWWYGYAITIELKVKEFSKHNQNESRKDQLTHFYIPPDIKSNIVRLYLINMAK